MALISMYKTELVPELRQFNHFKNLTTSKILFNRRELIIEYKKFRKSIYLIIDNYLSLCINARGVLCDVSVNESKPYYMHINSFTEKHLNFENFSMRYDFIENIKNLVQVEVKK